MIWSESTVLDPLRCCQGTRDRGSYHSPRCGQHCICADIERTACISIFFQTFAPSHRAQVLI